MPIPSWACAFLLPSSSPGFFAVGGVRWPSTIGPTIADHHRMKFFLKMKMFTSAVADENARSSGDSFFFRDCGDRFSMTDIQFQDDFGIVVDGAVAAPHFMQELDCLFAGFDFIDHDRCQPSRERAFPPGAAKSDKRDIFRNPKPESRQEEIDHLGDRIESGENRGGRLFP
jgi:hypothetical protein